MEAEAPRQWTYPEPKKPTLNPRATSFLSTYPMSNVLSSLDAPGSDETWETTYTLTRTARSGLSPVPPTTNYQPPPTSPPIRIAKPTPATTHQASKALRTNIQKTQVGQTQTQTRAQPSTVFYIGPLPPGIIIREIHESVRGYTPRTALFDVRSGMLRLELPYDLNWQQLNDWCQRGFRIGTIKLAVKMSVDDQDQFGDDTK